MNVYMINHPMVIYEHLLCHNKFQMDGAMVSPQSHNLKKYNVVLNPLFSKWSPIMRALPIGKHKANVMNIFMS
jgi:hypothetical protein